MMKNGILLLLFITSAAMTQELPLTQTTSSSQMRHIWRASWITHPTASTSDYGVFHFRRVFELPQKPEKLIVHVSGDNRYRLYVNGDYICEGPARDDLHHWPYETVDIAPHLRKGKNVIAAQVVNYGEDRPGGQFSWMTAFILQSKGKTILDTGPDWKVIRNEGVSALPIRPDNVENYYQVLGFYAACPMDNVTAADYPWGWQNIDYNDNKWPAARVIRKGAGRGFAFGTSWFLVPRDIALLEEKNEPIAAIERTSGMKATDGFLRGGDPLLIPAKTKASILLDNNVLTMGYPELTVSQGRDAEIKLTYAEALFDKNFVKGDRNDVLGKKIYGVYDLFKTDGGEARLFRPTWIRAFRYLQLDIQTADEPLILNSLHTRFTAYPLGEKASFASNDPSLAAIWQASWRSLRLCARETYFSDAYYEQMQYIGDTRVQGLASLVVSGDVSLFRNALRQFDESRVPNGLTQSRYPARELQIIPTYSLLYIAMVHDYMMYADDAQFIRSLKPSIESVLDWFEAHIDDTGLLTNLEWWNFCDWSPEYKVGIPPGAEQGHSTLITLQYIYALQKAADIFAWLGENSRAHQFELRADRSRHAVRLNCWEEKKELYAETPEKKQFSQHSNIFAILTDTHPKSRHVELMQKVLRDKNLIQTTFYFKFYLFEALQHCGLGDDYIQQLDPWRKFINLGLTTFPEDDSERPRSDCHPWSSSPCYHLLTLTAGIQPAEPGFKSVRIAPNFGKLTEIRAVHPHAKGNINVILHRQGESLSGAIALPPGLTGEFVWQGQTVPLAPGEQTIQNKK